MDNFHKLKEAANPKDTTAAGFKENPGKITADIIMQAITATFLVTAIIFFILHTLCFHIFTFSILNYIS